MFALSVDLALLQIPTDRFIIRCFAAALYQSGSGSIYGSQRRRRGRLHSHMFTRWHYYREIHMFFCSQITSHDQRKQKTQKSVWQCGAEAGGRIICPPTIHQKHTGV